MKIRNNCVLLLKAEKSDETEDKYEVMLTREGFEVKHLKTLEFVLKNLGELKEKLENPQDYAGIIFTTPRSVRAARDSLNGGSIDCNWKSKLNYVVGETTHSCAATELDLDCRGQDSGNANNLADVIVNETHDVEKPFLFPCGNLKTDTLINRLSDKGIEVEAITVYETVTNCNLDEEFRSVTENFTHIPEYFVYFSPSGVQGTLDHVKKIIDECNFLKIIAIGPTTKSALNSNNIQVNAVAAKPTPGDLLNALLS